MITLTDFRKRLEVLCINKGSPCLPKKYEDQQILFKSIILTFEPDKDYTEFEINNAITKWLAEIGRELDVDHVSLRRSLVDNRYISRDDEGRVYKVIKDRDELFDPEINDLDPANIINEALIRKEEKKREFLEKGKTE